MSVFLLPKWVTRKIDQIRRKFLWHGHKNQNGTSKGLYMVNWLLATRPRKLGGLGVRNIEVANQALIMKWMWFWTHQQHTWWKCATPMLHLADRPWDDPHATPFWRSMKNIAPVFNASVRYQVRNGQSVQFWNDTWLGTQLSLQFPALYQLIQNRYASVSDSFNAGQWVFQHSPLSIDAQIQKQQLLAMLQNVQFTQASDEIIWLRDATGFSVRSAYKFISYTPSPTSYLINLWLIKAPLRVLIFAWLMLNNRLTTVDNLVAKGWHLTNMCILCRADEETVTHLFHCCPFTCQLRRYIFAAFAQKYSISPRFQATVPTQMLTDKTERITVRQWELTTCFVIWRERCRRLFSDKQLSIVPLVREIRTEYASWFE